MNKSKRYYITTTAPYVNASPHIGLALELVQADLLARFNRLKGNQVIFGFGTDEHGQKIYQKAISKNKTPQEYVDEYAKKFNNLKKVLNLSYNSFVRTTDDHHKKAAQEFWKYCQKNEYIYKAKYKVKYCVGCELEKTDSELENGKCPIHPNMDLEVREEPNYYFKFSAFEKRLLDFYEKNPDFVKPSFRFKEIKNFVKKGLKDFSISRLKEKMPWGVPVPGDQKHVMYVWFDALVFYISALGWPQDQKKFENWWPVVQCAGKDNLRQQSAIWQAMLMSAGLPNSKQILIHGFITSKGKKMSKSLGNVVDPFEIVDQFGTDALRFYLLKEIPPFKDGDFTLSHFKKVYNSDLANGLGNLVQRVSKLCEKVDFKEPFVTNNFYQNHSGNIQRLIEKYQFHKALKYIGDHLSHLDKTIDQTQPWTKSGHELKSLLKPIIKEVLQISGALKPFLPETSERIEKIFTTLKIKAPKKPLFPRV